MVNIYVFAVMLVCCVIGLSLMILVPVQSPLASQLSGVPTVVQDRCVAHGANSGPDGVAVSETEIVPAGVTVADAMLEFPPSFVQNRV